MSEDASIVPAPGAIGPGRLILVVGPSGAGKDTLIGLARALCAEDRSIVFPRRIITRQASSFEDNRSVAPEEFVHRLQRCEFAVHWEAHGNRYALPVGINDAIREGRTVVANVSRTVIGALRRAYAHVVVIAITAPADVLERRIAARARLSDGNIAERLTRKVDGSEVSVDVTIVNAGSPDYHACQLVRAFRKEDSHGETGQARR